MSRSYRVVYLVVLVVALLPAGVRALFGMKGRVKAIEPSLAQAGEKLFRHEFKPADSLCSGGDGLGPVFNATSCVACHNQGGIGGGGGLEHNVTTFTVRSAGQSSREGVVHSMGVKNRETLRDVHPSLPAISRPNLEQIVRLNGRENHCITPPTGVHLSQRNTPALFGGKLIDDISDAAILANARKQRLSTGGSKASSETVAVGRPHVLADGRIGRFGWKGQTASLSDFVRGACANELGLGNPSQTQPVPLYMVASTKSPDTKLDLTAEQCDQMTAFCASLARPVERLPVNASAEQVTAGKKIFQEVGCATCHTPNLGGVEGLYSDLLLHRMGPDLVGGGSYGEPPPSADPNSREESPKPDEWRTPPLWGVADSAPYLHDGRAATLEEAIKMHRGQGQRAAQRYEALTDGNKKALVAFLKTLRAP